jgi:hypothetical protein
MTAAILIAEITAAAEAIQAAGTAEDARLLRLDLWRAGEDLRKLLMTRDDAEDMLERIAA